MSTYTYTIYDSDPHTSGGTAWPSHEDIEIEAASDEEAINAVRDVMSVEAAGLNQADGYEVGQTLYALVWDPYAALVGEPTYELTAEDLGVEDEAALPEDAVIVERMPEYLRDSHRAAHNWGSYPHNGAERVIMSRSEAEENVLGDEYDHIVRKAEQSDLADYEVAF
jgi:hypothetical protein